MSVGKQKIALGAFGCLVVGAALSFGITRHFSANPIEDVRPLPVEYIPNIQATVTPSPYDSYRRPDDDYQVVTITSAEAKLFTVQRIVVNGRVGQPVCDKSAEELRDFPSVFRPGDEAKLRVFNAADCGTRIVQVDVFTDIGGASLSWK